MGLGLGLGLGPPRPGPARPDQPRPPEQGLEQGVPPRRPGNSSADLAAQIEIAPEIEMGLEIASNVKWRHSQAILT